VKVTIDTVTSRIVCGALVLGSWSLCVSADQAYQEKSTSGSVVGAVVTVWSGVYSEGQAKRGQTVYGASCSNCHLDNLRGDSTSPTLVGNAFISDWENKNVRALYSRIISTMPQDNPGTLSESTVLDVVAYLFKVNGFPSGEKALESAREAQEIRIAREK
jgi:mono/diheme cytochrome c family protein